MYKIYCYSIADPSPVEAPAPAGAVGGPSGALPVTQFQFHVDDINVTSIAGLSIHLQINPQVCIINLFVI